MLKTPTIRCKNFILRAPKMSDCEHFYLWFRDKDIMRFFSSYFFEVSIIDLKRYFRSLLLNKTEEVFFVITDQNDIPIGGVGADGLDSINKSGDFWIMIGKKEFWGQGIGKGACIKFCEYFFEKMRYRRLNLEVTSTFKKGIQLYRKIGFKKEGVKREADFSAVVGKFEDQVLMSMLRKDWLKSDKK